MAGAADLSKSRLQLLACSGRAGLREEGVRWALLRASPSGRGAERFYRQKSVKMGKSVEPRPVWGWWMRGRSALSAVLAWGVLFLSFGYHYGLHDYGMQVLNAVLGMVVSFCDS